MPKTYSNIKVDFLWLQNRYWIFLKALTLLEKEPICLQISNKLLDNVLNSEAAIQRCSLAKGVLKTCSKFTGEHPWWGVISIKLLSIFIEITLQHECSPVNLLHIFRTPPDGCFHELLDILVRVVISILSLSLNSKQFHQKWYSNYFYIIDITCFFFLEINQALIINFWWHFGIKFHIW